MGWTVYNSDGQILQGSSTLADDAVTTAKILDANVTLAKMANNSVDSDQYVDGSIDNVHIATGLDAVKLADGSVTNAELQRINSLTGNVQTNLDLKATIANPTFTTAATSPSFITGNSGTIKLMDGNGSNFASIAAHATTTADIAYTWPPAGPATSGFALTSTTGGVMSWAAAGSQSFTGDTTITSGNLVIATAGKGIDFSAQADEATGETMTAELLDHYEEGTFTPSLTFDTPGDLSVVYSARSGWYTRVGRLVTVTLVCITTTWTHSSASGFLKIADLPFTCIAAIEPIGVVMTQGVTGPSNRTQTSLYMPSSTNYMKVYWSGSNVGLSQTYPGNAPSGTAQSYYCTISYMV
jgi:hypothetical protein